MRRTIPLFLVLIACATTAPRPTSLALSAAQPPIAKKAPHPTGHFGEQLTDDYYWLRQKGTPEVEAYLKAENEYTAAVMKPTEALQEQLYKEMVARIKETDRSAPFQRGGYWYYFRTEAGKEYPIYCRRQGSMEAPEQVYLDQNELAKGQKFVALGPRAMDDAEQQLAYSLDTTGFRQFQLRIKELSTGQELPERMERVTSAAWAAGGKTLFYTVEDPVAKRSYRLYRHAAGEPVEKDALVYEEKDERFNVHVSRTRSKRLLLLTIGSHTTTEARLLSAADPTGEWRVVEPRQQDHEYYVDDGIDTLYIRTNSGGRNFRLVSAPADSPARSNWKELIAHRDQVMLADFDVFAGALLLEERENGLPVLKLRDRKTGEETKIDQPEPVYDASPTDNPNYDAPAVRFSYQSRVTPVSVVEYDLAKRTRTIVKQLEVPGYDPALYTSERVWAQATDGTKVPIDLTYKKTTPRDGTAPLHLGGYGSYGAAIPVFFNANDVSALDRGVSVGWAHIRGGGELGKKWHDQGRMLNKKNTFTDFIAAAEHLIKERYTAADRLAISGGSAGGLLMGAVTNMRPDLFKAVLALVPFVDVVNTMDDESLPLTVSEFEEWGNPKVEDQYRYIRTYSPYDNIEAKAYPAMLVRSSYNDSQVMYWEPAKYVARLRATKTDQNPLLFKCDMEPAGHGGKSGRYERLRTVAFDQAFILGQIGAAGRQGK